MPIEREGSGLILAVVGDDKSGKDQFIQVASGLTFKEDPFEEYEFTLDNTPVTLLDTPSFGKSITLSDALRQTKEYLPQRFANNRKLDGVLFLHSIVKAGKDFLPTENFPIIEELCGTSALETLAIVTTMWNGNALAMNESRERSLKTHDRYFGHAIHKRARMYHYNDTKASASEVISRLSQAYDPSRSRIVRLKVNRPPPPPQVVETPPTSARDASDSDSPSPRSRSESLSPSGHGSQDNAELLKALGTMHQRTTDDLKKRLEEEKLAHFSTQAKLSQQLEERLALADQLEKEKLEGNGRHSTIRSECERLEIERDDWRRKYEDVDTLRTREAGEFDNKIREANVTIEALHTELQRAKDAEDRAVSEAKEATTRAENAERDRMATLTVRSQDANSSITKVDKATEFAETSWQSIDATTKPESGNGGIELSKPKRNWWRKLLGKLSGGRK